MFCGDLYAELLKRVEREETVALVTVIETSGSAPGKAGFKMLVDSAGNTLGTVGGGLVEATVIRDALESIRERKSRVCSYKLDRDKAGGIGMICGGEASVFIDVIAAPETLLIAGAGHVAQPLAAMGAILGFKVVVIDDREDFCNSERFPTAARCLVGDIGEMLAAAEITPNTYIVIITRGHAYDQKALEQTINTNAAYVGMIGSKKKVQTVFKDLRQKGFDESKIARVYAPIGMDIGAKTAEEIAVSIMAEIIAHKYGKSRKQVGATS
ncbi:MAG: XdhC/CoxI family protein [Bacillota bacterium]